MMGMSLRERPHGTIWPNTAAKKTSLCLEKAVMDTELEGLPREMVDSSLGTFDMGRAHSRGLSNTGQGITGFSSDD